MAFVNKFIQPMRPQLNEKTKFYFEFLNKYQCENNLQTKTKIEIILETY